MHHAAKLSLPKQTKECQMGALQLDGLPMSNEIGTIDCLGNCL